MVLIGPRMVLGYYISIKSLGMVLDYFCALPSNIERLDARGAAASKDIKDPAFF